MGYWCKTKLCLLVMGISPFFSFYSQTENRSVSNSYSLFRSFHLFNCEYLNIVANDEIQNYFSFYNFVEGRKQSLVFDDYLEQLTFPTLCSFKHNSTCYNSYELSYNLSYLKQTINNTLAHITQIKVTLHSVLGQAPYTERNVSVVRELVHTMW